MNIASICQRRIVTIDSASPLSEAAALMRDRHVGALVVTATAAEGQRVVGVVTDRDLVIHVLANDLNASIVEIGTLASGRIVSVNELDDLSDALEAMQASGVRRLLVTDDEECVIGIASLDDLLAACATQFDGLARIIRSGIDREVAATAPMAQAAPPGLRIPAVGTAGWGNPG